MKRLTYGSMFEGLENLSSAARAVLDFAVLRTATNYAIEYPTRVYLKEFMKWRGSTNEAASKKRVENAIKDLERARLEYRGECVARVTFGDYGDYVTITFPWRAFKLLQATYRNTWRDDGDNHPYAQLGICPAFFGCLIYAAATTNAITSNK